MLSIVMLGEVQWYPIISFLKASDASYIAPYAGYALSLVSLVSLIHY